MRLDRKLWEESAALVEACLDHPFVTGLRDGTLPAEAFRAYVAQDVFFLEAFCRAYALGLARSTDNEALETFSQLITGVGEELKLHTSYAATLGIDLGNVVPNRATRSYTDFLLATAWQGSLGEIVILRLNIVAFRARVVRCGQSFVMPVESVTIRSPKLGRNRSTTACRLTFGIPDPWKIAVRRY